MQEKDIFHPADEPVQRMGKKSFPGVEHVREQMHDFELPNNLRIATALALSTVTTISMVTSGQIKKWLNR